MLQIPMLFLRPLLGLTADFPRTFSKRRDMYTHKSPWQIGEWKGRRQAEQDSARAPEKEHKRWQVGLTMKLFDTVLPNDQPAIKAIMPTPAAVAITTTTQWLLLLLLEEKAADPINARGTECPRERFGCPMVAALTNHWTTTAQPWLIRTTTAATIGAAFP